MRSQPSRYQQTILVFNIRREQKGDPQPASTQTTPVLRLSQILRCSLTTYLQPWGTRKGGGLELKLSLGCLQNRYHSSYSRLSSRYTEEFDEYTLILLFTTNVQVPYPIRFRRPTYAVSTYAMCHIMLVMEGRLHKASAGRMTLSQLFNQALVASWLLFSGSRSLTFKFFQYRNPSRNTTQMQIVNCWVGRENEVDNLSASGVPFQG